MHESEDVLMRSSLKLEQLPNAFFPIDVAVDPTVHDVNCVQLSNALSPIVFAAGRFAVLSCVVAKAAVPAV